MTRNERVLCMVEEGHSYKQVAEAHGISRSAVAGVCARAALKTKPEHQAKNMREAHKGKRKPWAEWNFKRNPRERANKACELRQTGATLREIARALGYADASGVCRAVKQREQKGEAAQ